MKNEKGFSTADIIVSLIVIILFMSVIASGFYNYYTTATSVSRNSVALSYTIDVIEAVETMNYTDITQQSVNEKIQQMYTDKQLSDAYEVIATIEKYNETAGNTGKRDLIKTLTVTTKYKLGEKTEQIQISRLITI